MSFFTKSEWRILEHRLEVPDAIADAISDSDEYDYEEVFSRAEKLLRGSIKNFNSLDLAILRDCCEGSTFFCNAEDAVALGEISKGDLLASYRAAISLENKVGALIGSRVLIPR